MSSVIKPRKEYLLIAFTYIVTVFLAFVFWSWVLYFLQDGFMRTTGLEIIDQSDEWHPIFMGLLLFLSGITANYISKKIKRRFIVK
jgi:site-specific recombinase